MLHTYREALKILNNWGGIGTRPPAWTLVRMPYVVPAGIEEDMTHII